MSDFYVTPSFESLVHDALKLWPQSGACSESERLAREELVRGAVSMLLVTAHGLSAQEVVNTVTSPLRMAEALRAFEARAGEVHRWATRFGLSAA